MLGHVHKPQHREYNGIPIIYTGSPYATEYGEIEEKSYVIAEFDDHRDASGRILRSWYRVPTPRTPMFLLNMVYRSNTGEFYSADEATYEFNRSMAKGADIRFRYTVDGDHAEAAKHVALRAGQDLLAAGAYAVKVEEVRNPTTRARAPEIAEAQSVQDELQIFWKRSGLNLPPDRLERLLLKHSQIESEARNDPV